ncbi:hypothetical protein AK88_01679 [Plasmodium fragile]|uniref:Uncharacterized protein n=1 Tax=Plasmodium fragile TaxID=5857 RepID=A0A0D9QNI9_PLAFR|nr:uncharacterized protein AK88_01679 [Plasmodium fragile]KJP88599.1 hypothetical protein AK88_01679 [Plasmodium fragile]
MFNESSTNGQGVVKEWCMPKGDYSRSNNGSPRGLYKREEGEEEQDHTELMQNTLHMFDHIKYEKHIFSKIIKNVITFLNKLKEENKYYEFLFSYNTFVKKYGPLTDYICFKKVIERINKLDIIEVCISFNFNNDNIFQTLLSSYLELHLNEASNVYNVLLELTSVMIDGYATWEEQNKGDPDFLHILISQCELKYISKEEINKWLNYVIQHEDNYSNVLFSLIDFCLSLTNHVHALLAQGLVGCDTYNEYVNELVIQKRSLSRPSGEAHHKQHVGIHSAKFTTDQCGEQVRKEITPFGKYLLNDVTSESDSKKDRGAKLRTCVEDTPGHVYICTFEDKIVCMKSVDLIEQHSHDARMNEDRSIFVYAIKSWTSNLYILKVLVCTLLKAMKVAHHLKQDSLTKLFSFFNNVLSDIIKCFYQKKDVLFLNLFFTDILKTMHMLVSFYNENIEQTPKRTMLFYKCFNKVIDQICIYLHNKAFFSEMFLGRGEGIAQVGKCLQQYTHNFKETCYMLFCLFYAILEKINRVNNEIFIFFCCVLFEEEEKVLEATGGVTHSASESTEPRVVKSLYRTLCLNRKFLNKCKEDFRGKSINRIINIFIFLEKKINKYFFFFKYVFGFVWNRFGKGALSDERRTSRLHSFARSDYRAAHRRWSPSKPPNKMQTVMKRIKYVLLDMFTKYTKLLMVYRFHFARCTDAGKEKEPFTNEFLMYMKSIECVLFSVFVYCPNGVLTKLNAYATERGKLGKLSHGGGRSQFSAFNRELYCFEDGKWSVRRGTSCDTSSGAERRSRRGGSPDKSDNGSESFSGEDSYSSANSRGRRYLGKNSNTKVESERASDEWGTTHPCDLIVLNVLGIIYANVMEEVSSHRYCYVHFKHCLVHAEFVKKLRVVLLESGGGDLARMREKLPLRRDGRSGGNAPISCDEQRKGEVEGEMEVYADGESEVQIGKDGRSHHLACYFEFPYELLCMIIIHQLKCFSNDTLKCYTICTAVVEFLFYISSARNPYFFIISRRLWRLLGLQMNKGEETLALTMLTKILFHVLSGRGKEDTVVQSRNERLFTKSIYNNEKQNLLLSFLKKQFFINDVGKNYIFFYGILLKGIQSEELSLEVMQIFFSTFHVHLQYTLNVLLRFLNLYERGVDKAAREVAAEHVNGDEAAQTGHSSSLDVPLAPTEEGTSEPIEEANIISLFVYFDLMKVLPHNFLNIIGDINLMREIQKTFLFFIYVNDEYRLLEQREEEHKHIVMVNRIKRSGMDYYHSSAKIYFPLVISALISHYLLFIIRDSTFQIPGRLICNFYENFFSNRYLYTLCSNHVYMRVLSDSFVILQHLLEGEAKVGNGLLKDHQWGVVKGDEEETQKRDCVNEHGQDKHATQHLPFEETDAGGDKAGQDSSSQMTTLTSCLFQVYIHFLEEYATTFHASIATLVKNKILWRGGSMGEMSKGSSTTARLNGASGLNGLNGASNVNGLNGANTMNGLNGASSANGLSEPTLRSDMPALDESTFCQLIYVDLKREGKYTPSFSHLMHTLLDIFFCKPVMTSQERSRQVLVKEVVPLATLQTAEKLHLLQARRNKFLITFFRNTFYVQSCSGDYIKDSLSKLVGSPLLGKDRGYCKELEELARLVFCVGASSL